MRAMASMRPVRVALRAAARTRARAASSQGARPGPPTSRSTSRATSAQETGQVVSGACTMPASDRSSRSWRSCPSPGASQGSAWTAAGAERPASNTRLAREFRDPRAPVRPVHRERAPGLRPHVLGLEHHAVAEGLDPHPCARQRTSHCPVARARERPIVAVPSHELRARLVRELRELGRRLAAPHHQRGAARLEVRAQLRQTLEQEARPRRAALGAGEQALVEHEHRSESLRARRRRA